MTLRPVPPDPEVLAWLESDIRINEPAWGSVEIQPMVQLKGDYSPQCEQVRCWHYGHPGRVFSIPWTAEDEQYWLRTGDIWPGNTWDEMWEKYVPAWHASGRGNNLDWENW